MTAGLNTDSDAHTVQFDLCRSYMTSAELFGRAYDVVHLKSRLDNLWAFGSTAVRRVRVPVSESANKNGI